MPVPKSALVLLTLACLPTSAAADSSVSSRAAQVAIEKARSCDDNAALTFSQINSESAYTVARAAFEKCLPVWEDANHVYLDEKKKADVRLYTDEELKRNLYLLSTAVRALLDDREQNSIENWKRREIERLLVVVLEAKLKNKPIN
jgi:hypothetical protein